MEKDDEVMLVDDDDDSPNPQSTQDETRTCEETNGPASLELSSVAKEVSDTREKDEEEMAQITKTKKADRGNDLDKFKRRLIRAIARVILKDNCLTNEIWDELKKQTGCDCKLLWDRMRALTIKKLRRLITAEDVVANITSIARLSITDWLLFDLVLVHEKIDCIGEETLYPDLIETPKILRDLFRVVIQYGIEFLQGDELTKAWFEATKKYNGSTRQCSPMLLQRRWYQLKEAVREKFYQFWFSYRGDQRHLANANQFRPNDLDMDIVRTYKYIATQPFPTWEELITAKKIALPEDFERLQLAKRKIFRNENEPDLEVIEPEVETIDLELDSDSEESKDSSSMREMSDDVNQKDTTTVSDQSTSASDSHMNVEIVKTETIAELSDEDDVHILEPTSVPLESNSNDADQCDNDNSNEECEIQTPNEIRIADDVPILNNNEDLMNEEFPSSSSTSIKVENVVSNEQTDDDPEQKTSADKISKDDTEMRMPTIVASMSIENEIDDFESVMPKIANVSSAVVLADEPDAATINDKVECILESVVENINTKKFYNTLKRDRILPLKDNIENLDILVKKIIDEEIGVSKQKSEVEELESLNTIPSDIHIFDSIELEDDGIVYVEEEDTSKEKLNTEIKVENTESNDNTPTIDLKLLLTPVVYTKKLNDMDVFRFIDYDMVKDKRVIENADHESKPVDKNSVKMEEISQQRSLTPDNDTIDDETGSENSSEEDDSPEVISCSSWLLNKPRNLSYNPILLCKNPDFNTRLKRLSAGFFILPRNRDLLKECKPLTIDLHKAFESKLDNNTLYLKDTQFIQKIKVEAENVEEQNMSLSTLPIVNIAELTPDSINQSPMLSVADSHPAERNKVINLPDIDQVRRLNERLLVAEVTPIQVANTVKPPVNIVHPNLEATIQTIQTTAQNITKDENITISTNKGSGDPVKSTNFVTNEKSVMCNVKSSKKSNVHASTTPKEQIYNAHQQKNVKKCVARVNYYEVPWNRRVPKKLPIPKDRLLASDTVEKILSVCRGDVDTWPKGCKSFKIAMKKVMKAKGEIKSVPATKRKSMNDKHNEMYVPTNSNELSSVAEEVTTESESKITHVNTDKNQAVNLKKKSNFKLLKNRKIVNKNMENEFCCWARERILFFKTKRRCRPHRCPQPLCQCCCRQELIQEMLIKRKPDTGPVDISDFENKAVSAQPEAEIVLSENNQEQITSPSQSTSRVVSPVQVGKELTSNQMTIKVSVGINTDYDKDFENNFAARLSELNSVPKSINQESQSTDSLQDTYLSLKHNVSHQTQTSVNMTDTRSGAIVSKTMPHKSTTKARIKYSMNVPQHEANSKATDPYIYFRKIAPKEDSQTWSDATLNSNNENVFLQERSEKLDKVLFLTNDKMKQNYSRSPICLGKNKILLCSFGRPRVKNKVEVFQRDYNKGSENTQPQVSLPDGVRIVLLPNKELALSIDQGLELNPSELANLPALMASIQQQLKDSDLLNENEGHLNNQNINTIKNSNETEANLAHNSKNEIDNHESISSVPEDNCNDLLTKAQEVLDSDVNKEASIPLNVSTVTDLNDLDDTSTLQKKTILSDLMEMSGISAEDIHTTNNDNVAKQQLELTHHSTSILEGLQTQQANPPNEKTLHSNPLYDNHMVQTALNRCPELSIVCSYKELKYASENNAQFFKMDIETGVIIPISLCIKKQTQTGRCKPPFTWSKSVIDLTDEPEDDDIHQVPNEITDIEKPTSELSILKILEEKRKEMAVPVKLFSAAHPAILRHRKSLLLRPVKSDHNTEPRPKCKNRIRIIKIKSKRKLPKQCLTSIELDSDTEMKEVGHEGINNSIIMSEKTKVDSESDSDDEPLALIAKRKKESSNVTINQMQIVNAQNDESQKVDELNEHTDMVSEVTETENINSTIDQTSGSITEEVYIDSIPQADPVLLEAFDDIPESSEEDCILGV